jgi:hypothetical protein
MADVGLLPVMHVIDAWLRDLLDRSHDDDTR